MNISTSNVDTIIAQATPHGRGGVGIVRLSGPKSLEYAKQVVRLSRTNYSAPLDSLKPRFAHFAHIIDSKDMLIDEAIVLYFPGPNSFTGEDVVELQGHGGPIVMDSMIKRFTELGARLARPGEFSERAFLNDKLDLVQAEAIADLIDSSSVQAARSAVRSLKGEFSNHINSLVEELIRLRIYVEAAIDFPEEEIDFLSDDNINEGVDKVLQSLRRILNTANQGALLREGMNVVIAGRPNAGKSSLLNCLAGENRAIVTAIAGTTRDVLKEHIQIDGMPLHIIDTAGLRESPDEVEIEGIRRAWKEIEKADQILLVVDVNETEIVKNPSKADIFSIWKSLDFSNSKQAHQFLEKIILIRNKVDLIPGEPFGKHDNNNVISLSAKKNQGIDILKDHLKQIMGYKDQGEGQFSARRRHIDAIERALWFAEKGRLQLVNKGAGELLAEDLRQAQYCLSEITGEFTSDDLLGRIFSSFCIGK